MPRIPRQKDRNGEVGKRKGQEGQNNLFTIAIKTVSHDQSGPNQKMKARILCPIRFFELWTL